MIHIESLTKYYNDLCAVDQISFDITKGEIMGLLGPNGAGKTTTLQILTGFLRPTSGSIRVKDYSIDKDSLQIKKLLGYLPESAPLYHDMLVYDYLDYVANLRGIDSSNKISRIRHLADLCGISEVMHKTINELSKGFKQRVGLAHAMMDDPEILVLDEPTSGLDPNQIIEIRDIIKQIGKEKTVILSTHILSEAEATCDRIVIINKGKIVANDTTQTLKQSASGSNLINISLQNAEFESVKQQLTSISEISDIVQASDDNGILNLKLTCLSSADIRGDIYKKVKQTDWILLEMHQETQTLENIFRELTREN
ncbi:MAG: ATP-binding cassette domain-containing protein [Desulfobacterales bacterium]|nr:ATP-binding cassette domain-containing protein [Desulfobacterales bacterium]MDX2507926.1 ATP-binding cassette domain-containing protein [Desulfobacterales bacterium]